MKLVNHTMIEQPWASVKSALVRPLSLCLVLNRLIQYMELNGMAVQSIAASFLEGLPQGESRAEKELIGKNCVGTAHAGK